jgi:hypothetical protein
MASSRGNDNDAITTYSFTKTGVCCGVSKGEKHSIKTETPVTFREKKKQFTFKKMTH